MKNILDMMKNQWVNVPWPSELPVSALGGSCHYLQVLRKQVNPGQLDWLESFLALLVSPWMFTSSSESPIFLKQMGQKVFHCYIGSTQAVGELDLL